MAYEPTNWENREVERPRTYIMTQNPDGTVTLTPSEGQVFVGGTPIIAENMNKIEDQLVVVDNHIVDFNNPHHVTPNQIGVYTTQEVQAYFARKNDVYTKSQVDAKVASGAERANIYMFKREYGNYVENIWNNIYFSSQEPDEVVGFENLEGYGALVPKTAFYIITATLSFSNVRNFTTGFAAVELRAGGKAFRLGANNYNSSSHTSISGTAIVHLNKNDQVRLYAKCNEPFTVYGTEDAGTSFMAIRELA